MSAKPILLWLRLDLRLADHPALHAAVQTGRPVVPVFIHAPEEEKPWQPGAASRWWLHHSLQSLDTDLRKIGSRLIFRQGESLRALREIVESTGADSVFFSRRYEPAMAARDAAVVRELNDGGIETRSFNSALLIEPEDVLTGSGTPFKVFTPFWRKVSSFMPPDKPLSAPRHLPAPAKWPQSLSIKDLELLPTIPWDEGLRETWQPGEQSALSRLDFFCKEAVFEYATERDRMDLDQTSRLSPHLHFGEISPRTIWHRVAAMGATGKAAQSMEAYLRQLVWREFAHALLVHFPHTTEKSLRPEFERFPWVYDQAKLTAWQKGQTGYPVVDAAMRQLWRIGWMHNRARLIVASFLVKDLRMHWLEGARWFWDTLVDADLANNTLGWQWVAGSGADAAPYFRIFNPASQAEKFDPTGDYVRRYVGEQADQRPIVDHQVARLQALAAYEQMRKTR